MYLGLAQSSGVVRAASWITMFCLTARSDSEENNYISLNLADEIVHGKKSVAEARNFYAKTEQLGLSGKTSSYSQGLLFQPGTTTK